MRGEEQLCGCYTCVARHNCDGTVRCPAQRIKTRRQFAQLAVDRLMYLFVSLCCAGTLALKCLMYLLLSFVVDELKRNKKLQILILVE